MMLQRALTGACRSASRLQLQATATRSLMMMAGGDIPAPMSGTVKRFDSKKGFGFIAPNGGGPDVFVHQSEIKRQGFRFLAEGEAVEFRVEEAGNGKARAFDVTGPNGQVLPARDRAPPRRFDGPPSPGGGRRPRGPPRRFDRDGPGYDRGQGY